MTDRLSRIICRAASSLTTLHAPRQPVKVLDRDVEPILIAQQAGARLQPGGKERADDSTSRS
jgi:hypothetical protein